MDWDDEFNAGYDEMAHGAHRSGAMPEEASLGGLDPMDISDPASAHFLLCDDAQDKITGTGKPKMKCRVCGRIFRGEMYDRGMRTEPIRSIGGRRRTVADGVRPNRLQRFFERPTPVACRTGAGATLGSPFGVLSLVTLSRRAPPRTRNLLSPQFVVTRPEHRVCRDVAWMNAANQPRGFLRRLD
jgi:hypothetical protein